MTHKTNRRLWSGGLVAPLLLLTQSTGGLFSQSPDLLDEIVARVNNEIITLSDLESELSYMKRSLRENFKNPEDLDAQFQKRKKNVLRFMIEEKLMVQMAEEFGLAANIDIEVSTMLEEILKESGIPNMEVFDQILRQRGSSLAEFRERRKTALIVRSLVGQMVHSKITLLTPEIEAYYQDNLERFTEPAEVELAEILFLTEGKDKSQVRQRAEKMLAKLKAGAVFEELAKQHSDGPTASNGGLIGSFKKGSITPSLERIVFDLDPEQTSGIVEADYGLQIVKLIGKKESRHKALEEVRNTIQDELYQKKLQPEMEEFREQLRMQSYVLIDSKYKKEYNGWWN